MAPIRVVSTTKIQARSEVNNCDSSEEIIELNPWDLQFLLSEYCQKAVLFRKPSSSSSSSSSSSVYMEKTIQYIKDTLSSTLHFFRTLAGRLVMIPHGSGDDDTFSISVTCNNAGASFVHAIAENTTVSDITESTYVPLFVHSFFPHYRSKNIEGSRIPLLGVQVTELVDGIFMNATPFNNGIWDFMNAWANISRYGLNFTGSTSKLASFQRWFPHGNIECPIRIPRRVIKETNITNASYMDSHHHRPFPLSQRIFHFTREKIMELKAKANSEIEDEDGVISNKISSLQAVTSHVWISVIKNQHLDPEEMVIYRLFLAVGPRRISDPLIPDNYFGPKVLFSYVKMKVRDLVGDKGLGKFALEMNKIISSFTEEKIKRHFEEWARNPNMPPKSEVSDTIGKFMGTSSCPRTNFYTIDFGCGRPAAVHSGLSNPKTWKLVFDAGAEEGSFDIELYASYEILEALARDPEFMQGVSSPPPPPR